MAAADVQSNIVLSSTESESDDESVQLTRYDVPSSSSAIIPPKVKEQIKASEGADTSLPETDKIQRVTLSSSLEPGIDVSSLTYLNIFRGQSLKKNAVNKDLKDELESKSIVHQPGFEKQLVLPPYLEGRRKVKRERLKERDKTAGPGWFNLPAAEMTEERKNDLAVLQMRGSLDPKRFYKRGSEQITPKYFSIGTVIEHAVDFYHARIPKKQRKQTLVDELLADAEYTKYQKRKLAEAMKNLPKKTYTSKKNKKSKMKELNKPENKKVKHSS